MGSILLASCPFRGHVTPTLRLAAGLADAGHRVRVVTGHRYAEQVTRAGAELVQLPAAADLDEDRLLETFPERADLTGPAAARFDMTRIFLEPVPAQLAAVDGALAEEAADVVVAEPLFLAALALVGRRTAPPVLTLGTMPPLGRQTAMPPLGPPWRGLGPLAPRAHATAHGVLQRLLFGPVQREAERLFATLGEPAPTTFFLDWPRAGAGILQLSVPAFEPVAGLPVPVHHVGALAGPPGRPDGEPPSWWPRVQQAAAEGVPVVHATQGTAANTDLGQLVAPTIRALAGRPVLVVATTGGRDPGDLSQSLPANAVLERWVDYSWLLPSTAVMVTNGGYGGVHEALRHGVPLVLAGAQQDKAAIATRVRRSGAGLAVTTLSPSEPDLDRLVGTVLHDGGYRAAAQRLAADLAAAPGLPGAVAVVESHLQGRAARA
ncbi:glycosyltransferase [Ornithinimicrobium cavernae]|uniref:glycosyltransferase n=1 Tax=Ornithinimicrobium cavernae TaxID=2666047 RepID=UPI000D68EBBF|nr:glycosyltransferase [Ornithinimicrobium cavernae]